jgi:chemotaxis protein MotA
MAETKARGKASGKPDFATIAGIVLALAGIVGGLLLEGGRLGDILQMTAAFIVLGGTCGAVMINTPLPTLLGASRRFLAVLFDRSEPPAALIEEIINYATKARKNGLVSLEQEAEQIEDPFLKKALTLAVDGTDLQEIRKMLELSMALEEHRADDEAKVFESAGGYAPTIGIIGAVMGLIQVMKNLANIDEVGHGIAVAFVATLYGVGLANIFLLPAANKIKARAKQDAMIKELIVEGVSGIVEGLNPKLIRSKIEAFNHLPAPPKKQAPPEPAAPALESEA